MKSIIKKLSLLAITGLAIGAFAFTSPATNNHLADALEVHQDNNPRGTVDRNGIKYKWELINLNKGNIFQLKIVKEHKGTSNLVYSTDVVYENNSFKIYLSKQNGYKWDLDRSSFLLMKYEGNSGTFSAEGAMKSMAESNFGISEAQLKSKNMPKKNSLYDFCAYTTTHFIFKYKKAMKP